MKMYDAQSVNTCVKLAGFVNWKNKKASAFSASKSSDTRNSETGAEEYTIPASNAFGLPHSFPVWQSGGSFVRENPWNPQKMKKEKVTMLKFICGVLVGGIIGVVLMCLLQINKIQ